MRGPNRPQRRREDAAMASNIRLSGSQSDPRSESDVRINPGNVSQIIAGSNNSVSGGTLGMYYSAAGRTPLQVSGADSSGTDGGDIKTNANGDVFAFWPSEAADALFVAKSTDGGASFTALGANPVKIASTFASFIYRFPADDLRG